MTTSDFNVSKDIVPGWNGNLTYPMHVDGPVKHTLERITVLAENGSPQYVDNQSMLFSDGVAIQYAGGIQISLEIGILSLASQITLTPLPSGGPSWYTYTLLSFLGRDSTPETPISSQSVCTSIASSLPLNYNAGLQLYTWDLTHPLLPTLLTSFSTLQFTFTNSSGTSTTVSIPLALLNLTLTPPLVPETIPYFLCRPYSPENDTGEYYLGRAFLQGAFIGQNWDSGVYFLAQAPGPNLPRS